MRLIVKSLNKIKKLTNNNFFLTNNYIWVTLKIANNYLKIISKFLKSNHFFIKIISKKNKKYNSFFLKKKRYLLINIKKNNNIIIKTNLLNEIYNKKKSALLNIISLKKKTGIFKTKINRLKTILFNFKKKKLPNYNFNNLKKKTEQNQYLVKNNKQLNANVINYKELYPSYWKNKNFLNLQLNYKILSFKSRWIYRLKMNRNILKNLLFLKKNLQEFKLTKYVNNFSNFSAKLILNSIEYNLGITLIKSKLSLTIHHSKELIRLGLVFVNNKCANNYWDKINSGDKINIIYDREYFNNYKYLLFLLKKKELKTKYCIWRLFRNKFDFYKQKPSKFPLWINSLIFKYSYIPTYMEVDYKTLTCIILNKTYNLNKITWYNLKFIAFYSLKTYKWKYIV